MLSNLLVRAVSVLGLLDVPAGDVLLRNTGLDKQVNGTLATSAQSAKNHDCRLAAEGLLSRCDILADLAHELILVEVVSAAVGEGAHRGELLAGMRELPVPGLDTKCCAGETSVEAKCGPNVCQFGL